MTRQLTPQQVLGGRLKAFVEAVDGKLMTWGSDDCSTWPAQWVSERTGRELAWPFYEDRESAERVINEAGGLARVWRGVAIQAGLEERGDLSAADVGDVGIIKTSRFGDVGGIFAFGRAFAWRVENGVRWMAPPLHTIVAVWRLP